jgi:hypothetical protein
MSGDVSETTRVNKLPAAASGAPLGPTLALTLTLAVACFAVLMAAVMLHSTGTSLGPGQEEHQSAESTVYVIAFGLILPAAVILVPRLADTIAAGPNGGGLSLLTAVLVATLAASILVTSVLPGGGGLVDEVAVSGTWSLGALVVLARARQRRPWARLLDLAHLAPFAWGLAGGLVFAALLAFTSLGSLSPVPIVIGAIVVPIVLLVYGRRGGASPLSVSRRRGLAIDACVIVVLLLAVPDLGFVHSAVGQLAQALNSAVIQYHHNLWLGPVNELLAGRALLVDNASQYGIGPIYLLAGWFQIAPIGYGTFGFLDGVLSAGYFAVGYCVLRLAGTPRMLAAGAMALAVIVLIYNLDFAVGAVPQSGPLRFGLPMLLILASVAEARFSRHRRAADAAQLTVLGLASIWALETFAYTVATFAAIACFQAWARPGPGRLRWLARRGALAIVACVAANVTLAALTLAFAGQLPDYGQYFFYLDEFLFGVQSLLTVDFYHWSPGLPVGVACAASAAAFVLLVRRRRDIVEGEWAALTALCGTSAYGIVLFSYFVDRSANNSILPHVALPVVLAGTIWLSLLLRGALVESRPARVGGLAFALAVSVLLLSIAWSSIGDRFSNSPLAHIVPGGESMREATHRLWHLPPFDTRAPEGERLLDRYMPGQDRVLILVRPGLATEILMRSGRSNQLPFTDPVEDSNYGYLGTERTTAMEQAIANLQPGERLLMQRGGLRVFDVLKRQPSRDVFHNPVAFPRTLAGRLGQETNPYSQFLEPLQQLVLQRIGERFRLRVLHHDGQGFVVATLSSRR